MTAAVIGRVRSERSGSRPVDPRRDMRAVADLIEIAFSGRLDMDGRRMLRWMRILGRAGRLGWFLSSYLLPSAGRPLGYVWEAEGRIIGNVSALTVGGYPTRWVLVNVAVHPDYQHKGIARKLTQSSLDLIQKRGGKEILLQVDKNNQRALDLYASLGFSVIATRTTWVRKAGKAQISFPISAHPRRRRQEEWGQQWSLARRLHPEGLIWPFPPTASIFRPRRLADALSFGTGWHWVWAESDRMSASLSARWESERNHWRLILIAEPDVRGRVEKMLLERCITELPSAGRDLMLEYPDGAAEGPIRELGFSAKRTLVWMMQEI